eukprot:gene32937-40656_t
MKPYLINQKKFDLRIYVLVSGVDPLRIYIHEEGLTRLSTAKYSLSNISNRFAHLTNYSINKKATVFKAATMQADSPSAKNQQQQSSNLDDDDDDQDGDEDTDLPESSPVKPGGVDPETEGYKWSLTAFRRWLSLKTSPEVAAATFTRIHDLCVKTVIAAEGEITPQLHQSTSYRTNCFELFGMDVILDHRLEPSLLEVNVSPSLMGSSPLDKRIKGTVVADMLHIVGIYPHDTKLLKRYNNTGRGGGGGGSGSPAPGRSRSASRGRLVTNPEEHSSSSGNTSGGGNPFTYTSLSKMMNSQDIYRKNPCAASIDLSKLSPQDEASWLMLLMVEDELMRAKSGRFQLVHPLPASNGRFSDH